MIDKDECRCHDNYECGTCAIEREWKEKAEREAELAALRDRVEKAEAEARMAQGRYEHWFKECKKVTADFYAAQAEVKRLREGLEEIERVYVSSRTPAIGLAISTLLRGKS